MTIKEVKKTKKPITVELVPYQREPNHLFPVFDFRPSQIVLLVVSRVVV